MMVDKIYDMVKQMEESGFHFASNDDVTIVYEGKEDDDYRVTFYKSRRTAFVNLQMSDGYNKDVLKWASSVEE